MLSLPLARRAAIRHLHLECEGAAVEGVPLITPAPLKVRPPGNGPDPDARDQASGAMPPVAVRAWL